MGKFRLKADIIEAYRWFKNGDHPLDKPPGYRPGDEGAFIGYTKGKESFLARKCDKCGAVMRVHGEINRPGDDINAGLWYICPGSWVWVYPDGGIETMAHETFMELYEEVDDNGAPLAKEPAITQQLMRELEALKNPYEGRPIPEHQCPTCKFDVPTHNICMKDRRRIQQDEADRFFKAIDCPFWEFGKELLVPPAPPIPKPPKRSSDGKKRGRPRKFISPHGVDDESVTT